MTTIGSTAYYSTTPRYGGSEIANSSIKDDVYAASSQPHKSDGARSGHGDAENSYDSRPTPATLRFQGRIISSTFLGTGLDLKPIDYSSLPADRFNEYMEGHERVLATMQSLLEHEHTQFAEPDFSGDSRTMDYATVTVGGRVVATIDNQGVVDTASDALGKRLRDVLLGELNGTNGPDLAQARAEQIANMLGGRIAKSSTALTQRQFSDLPPAGQRTATVDYDGLVNDPRYQSLQNSYAMFEQIKADREASLA